MKIILITDFLYGGGAEEVVRMTSEILKNNNHTVEIFWGSKEQSYPDDVFSYVYSKKNKNLLYEKLILFKPNVIHVHNYYHILSCSIFDAIKKYKQKYHVKVLFTAHDFHLISPSSHLLYYNENTPFNIPLSNTFSLQLFKKIDQRGWKYSVVKKIKYIFELLYCNPRNTIDLIISPSHFLKRVFVDNNIKCPIEVVRNPLLINKRSQIKRNNQQFEKLRFLYFGRISREKGLLNFIEFCEQTKLRIQLDIIGIGEDYAVLCEMKTQFVKLNLYGKFEHSELQKILSDYDIAVIPSVGYENAPLTIPEAANAGLMIWGTNRGGIKEMCEECNVPYFLFDPCSIQSFQISINELKNRLKKNDNINTKLDVFTSEFYYSKLIECYK